MTASGPAWLDELPDELSGQRRIMQRLRAYCAASPDVRWLLVGCSLARGAADRLSDLDLAAGVVTDRFEEAALGLRAAMAGLGELVDSFHHQLPGVPEPHERIFAQYADRCQVDLVVLPAEQTGGEMPPALVIYDPDGMVSSRGRAGQITPEQAREWAFLGWCALADLGKYLRRGSAWEALDRLNEARSMLWRLWAAAHGVPDPQYGLVSVLDFAPDDAPAELADTVAGLDPAGLLDAARRLADLLRATGADLPAELRAALPAPMAAFIVADLAGLAAR
jgi:hypothetical protein